tara:strand:- start:1404 stop:1823 length:420 start_codon:yes stop_codon:yes gene_type:complete
MEYMMLKANNLFSQREDIKARIDAEKKKLSEIDNQIKDLYLPVGKEQLGSEEKDFGTTTVNLPEGKAKVTISKKVEWDQKKLVEIGNQLDPTVANTLIKYVVKVDETVYKNLDDNFKELFVDARIVKEGTITISEVKEN